jgi:hypothetical protein
MESPRELSPRQFAIYRAASYCAAPYCAVSYCRPIARDRSACDIRNPSSGFDRNAQALSEQHLASPSRLVVFAVRGNL